jgi:serine protease Do
MGVAVQEVTQGLADSFGLPRPQGALVSSVEKDSPAERAGLASGDVIVRLNDRDINRSSDLPALVADLRPGMNAKLDVIRKGTPKTLSVTVAEMKDAVVAQRSDTPKEKGRLGLAVRPLAREELAQAGVPGGLLVEDVSGPAAKSGIEPGDIILSLNGTPVSSATQLSGLANKAGKHVALLVQRDASKIFVPIDLG